MDHGRSSIEEAEGRASGGGGRERERRSFRCRCLSWCVAPSWLWWPAGAGSSLDGASALPTAQRAPGGSGSMKRRRSGELAAEAMVVEGTLPTECELAAEAKLPAEGELAAEGKLSAVEETSVQRPKGNRLE
nr:unnamed protein product [Digitaria exilis]